MRKVESEERRGKVSLSQERIDVSQVDLDIELSQRSDQLIFRDVMRLLWIQIIENGFQAEITFVDLKMTTDLRSDRNSRRDEPFDPKTEETHRSRAIV